MGLRRYSLINNKRKLKTAVILAALTTFLSGCGADSAQTTTEANMNNSLTGVKVNASVRKTGQYPENFVLTFSNDIEGKELSASQFSMKGKAGMWGSNDTRDFSCDFESAEIKGNTLTLTPHEFPEKFFYVKNYEVTCSDNPEFGFTEKDVTGVATPIADDFETVSYKGDASFDYRLYRPSEESKMPIVIVFHGFGDTSNLLTYRTAVEWAEPENQAVRPCYVLAPVIGDSSYFQVSSRGKVLDSVKDIVDTMISEGKVDSSRVYVMGNSFGGLSTLEICEKYPDFFAAAMALCPATTYAQTAAANLPKMAEVPIWFAHAEHDNTIPVTASREAVDLLNSSGAKEVKYTEYTDDQMNAAGADGSPDSTYSYHHVELAVMEDEAYMEWLFSHSK